MTRTELKAQLALIIQSEIPTYRKVEAIFVAFSKLSPEPNSGNIKEPVVDYNKHLAKKVIRKNKVKFRPEQHRNARAILRKMGMI